MPLGAKHLWLAPKPIPDKGRHPNFPHIQSIEYVEHADQPRACRKTQGKQQKCSRKKDHAEHADSQRETKMEKAETGEGDFVRDGFGRHGIFISLYRSKFFATMEVNGRGGFQTEGFFPTPQTF